MSAPPPGGRKPEASRPKGAVRRDREAAALRENLRRRKEQARTRATGRGDPPPEPGDGGARD